MAGLLDILAGPVKGLVNSIGGVIDSLTTSEEEKMAAKLKLYELQSSFSAQMAKAQAEFAAQQAEVIKAEAQGESWLQRNWRPVIMLMFGYIVAHNYIFSPVFSVASLPIPTDLWDLLKIGMGGYIGGRTLEKVVPQVAEIVTAKKK
jgi:hypothetical protein